MHSGHFNFIGEEFENLFQCAGLFLPGIEKIAGIYYSVSGRQLTMLSRDRDDTVPRQPEQLFGKRDNLVMIQKFRAVSQPFTWIKKDELPFEIPEKPQLAVPDLFSELDHVILLLRFRNESDQLNDLLFVYFNRNLGNFGLTKSDRVLTPDNKTIIGHLLYHQFQSMLLINRENKVLLNTLTGVVRNMAKENHSIKEQFTQLQSSYGENIVSMALQFLKEINAESGKTILLDDTAEAKLRTYKGNLKHIRAILKNAIIFTENLLGPEEGQVVHIHDYCLDFNSYQIDERAETTARRIDSRQSRALQLLDKLERAAVVLQNKKQPLISTRVGKTLEPPVSAPAITDALDKNKDMIRVLLAKYPDKWEVIRKDFKPLHNLMKKFSEIGDQVESA